MEGGDIPKLDVMLMRSKSGNQILDIDFGGGETMNLSQANVAAQHAQHGAALVHATAAPMAHSAQQPGFANGQGAAHPAMMAMYNGAMSQGVPSQAQVIQQPITSSQPLHIAGGHQVVAPRRLKILEHHVHRIDTSTKDNGQPEEELVVSNLRHFSIKVGLVDQSDNPIMDTELPLLATLLYENGLPVKQLSNSEPLLVGDPEVVCLQGQAVFKLRITSLSSHRDKQRFRIQIAPQNIMLRNSEPALTVVTDAMKSVTKLAHRSAAKDPQQQGQEGAGGGAAAGHKRPRDDDASEQELRALSKAMREQAAQIESLQAMQATALEQLRQIGALVRTLVPADAAAKALAEAPPVAVSAPVRAQSEEADPAPEGDEDDDDEQRAE